MPTVLRLKLRRPAQGAIGVASAFSNARKQHAAPRPARAALPGVSGIANGRCRMHGGWFTGPRTEEGIRCISEAQKRAMSKVAGRTRNRHRVLVTITPVLICVRCVLVRLFGQLGSASRAPLASCMASIFCSCFSFGQSTILACRGCGVVSGTARKPVCLTSAAVVSPRAQSVRLLGSAT